MGGHMDHKCDVIVIGAGIMGAATARELRRYDLDVVVCEAGLDLACGATRANSGIVHAGFDPMPGTLKAKYNVAGASMFEQWQRELGFGFYRNGALVVAFDEDERAVLEGLLERARENGVAGVEIVEADELMAMEPNVSRDALCALSAPTSGICDPYGFCYACAENAAENGAEFVFDARVIGIEREGAGFVVTVRDGRTLSARAIVNCAGIHADEMNNLVSEHTLAIAPVKGEYLLFHNALAGTFRHTMFQVPSAAGKGVLVSPVIFGNIFLGPNASPARDKDDLETSEEGLREVLRCARRVWGDVTCDQVIATYAGLRAKDATGAGDFVVAEAADVPGFFNVACIDSPGLASAPAIACDVSHMVAARLGAGPNEDFKARRIPAPLLVMMDEKSVRALKEQNPLYDVPVCKCCHVSEGEIVDALHRPLPVRSLDALKWRTGATMGPCHGGRCTARILEIVERELGVEAKDFEKRLSGSRFVVEGGACQGGGEAWEDVARRCGQLAAMAREDLDGRGLREVGSGSLGIAGTRPAGVYSALETLGLFALTCRLPGERAIVWGTHDVALQVAVALLDAGASVERILESESVPQGASELVDELEARGIAIQCNARVVKVDGASRLESATVESGGKRETIACDLLVASPRIVCE